MNHHMNFHFKLKVPLWFLNDEICQENGCSVEEPQHVDFSLHDSSRTSIQAYFQLDHNTL